MKMKAKAKLAHFLTKLQRLNMSIKNMFLLFRYKKNGSKTLIVQAAAGLGDYLWIRNYLPLIKADPVYKNHKIALCCTQRWLDFSKELDGKYIDIFLPFKNPNKPKWTEKLPLLSCRFDVSINFHSYHFWKELNETIKAENIFSIKDIPENIENSFYDTRNNAFMSRIIQLPKQFKHTLTVKQNLYDMPKAITLVLGGLSQGKLSLQQLEFIIKKTSSEFPYDILLLGERSNIPIYQEILARTPDLQKRLVNGCGKFSQTELIEVIKNSIFVITPDTSIFHMALQLEKDILCLSNFNGVSWYDSSKVCHLRASTMQDISKEMLSEGIMKIKYQLMSNG